MATTNTHPKRQIRGFTLIEMIVAFAVVALLVGTSATVRMAIVTDAEHTLAVTQAAALNAAMIEYRARIAEGYAPATPWSATTADGILLELAKPLWRNGRSVTVLPNTEGARAVGVTPSDFSKNATWAGV